MFAVCIKKNLKKKKDFFLKSKAFSIIAEENVWAFLIMFNVFKAFIIKFLNFVLFSTFENEIFLRYLQRWSYTIKFQDLTTTG